MAGVRGLVLIAADIPAAEQGIPLMARNRSYVIDCETYQQSNVYLTDLNHLLGHLFVLALLGCRAIDSSGLKNADLSLNYTVVLRS